MGPNAQLQGLGLCPSFPSCHCPAPALPPAPRATFPPCALPRLCSCSAAGPWQGSAIIHSLPGCLMAVSILKGLRNSAGMMKGWEAVIYWWDIKGVKYEKLK